MQKPDQKTMLYPIMLDLRNRNCIVIGGGRIAHQKLVTLIKTGANIKVIAPRIDFDVEEMGKQGYLQIIRREYQSKDIEDAFIVVGATNNRKVNEQISKDARKKNLLVNIVDTPDLCVYQVPASVKRDDLVIAISTHGKSPAIAKKIRKELEEKYGDEYTEFLEIIDKWRTRMKQCEQLTLPQREHLFNLIAESDIIDLLKQGKKQDALTKIALMVADYTKKESIKSNTGLTIK